MGNNTSAQKGYLTPVDGTPPLEGQALEDFFNGIIAGLTGLDADNLIIPAWQTEPPNLPDVGTTWCAFRIKDREGDPYAAETHNPGDGTIIGFQGSDTVQRQEKMSLECSFYGPAADATAALFRDGLSVSQNREVLKAQYFGLLSVGRIDAIPSLIKEKWLYRAVLTATFRRTITRTYQVLDLLSAGGTVNSEAVTDTFSATVTQT